MWKHKGPVRVFDGVDAAMKENLSKKIREGDVIVLRHENQRGGPGVTEKLSPTSELMGLQHNQFVLITGGRFSGGFRGPLYRPCFPGSGSWRTDCTGRGKKPD